MSKSDLPLYKMAVYTCKHIQHTIQIRQVYTTDLIQFLLEARKQLQLSLHVSYFLCRIFSSVCFQWIVLIQHCCSCIFESKHVTLETPVRGVLMLGLHHETW